MAGFNSIALMGTAERIEYKDIGPNKLCKFLLKSIRTYEAKGTPMQDICFIEVTTWNKLAEQCQKELIEGSTCIVEGTLKQETWDDPKGNKRYKHIIAASHISAITEHDLPHTTEYKDKQSERIELIRKEVEEDQLPF